MSINNNPDNFLNTPAFDALRKMHEQFNNSSFAVTIRELQKTIDAVKILLKFDHSVREKNVLFRNVLRTNAILPRHNTQALRSRERTTSHFRRKGTRRHHTPVTPSSLPDAGESAKRSSSCAVAATVSNLLFFFSHRGRHVLYLHRMPDVQTARPAHQMLEHRGYDR